MADPRPAGPRHPGDHPVAASERPGLAGVAITIGGIALGGLLILAIAPLREAVGDALHGNTAALRDGLRDLGAGGALVVIGVAIAHSVIWYPAEILDAAAGFVYGVPVGLPLVMVGWVLNGLISYLIGAHAARPLLLRLSGRERFLHYESIVERGGVTLLLGMRLIPVVPFSLFSYVAGSARVPIWRFAWTTAVGCVPITAAFVYLGSRLETISATDPVLWIAAVVLVALLLLSHRLIPREPAEPGGPSPPAGGGAEG